MIVEIESARKRRDARRELVSEQIADLSLDELGDMVFAAELNDLRIRFKREGASLDLAGPAPPSTPRGA